APVRVERRAAQLRTLGRQPPLREVVAERDPVGGPVVAVVDALDDLVQQLLGGPARVARGVPAADALAGRRVGALVDDCVVALAALDDVTSHWMTPRTRR